MLPDKRWNFAGRLGGGTPYIARTTAKIDKLKDLTVIYLISL